MRYLRHLFTFPYVILPILLLLGAYTFFSLPIEHADAMTNWTRNTRLVIEGGPLGTDHHAMRWWGTLLATVSIWLFGDGQAVYYLSPMVSMFLFLVTFSFVTERLLAPGYVALFLLFYVTSPALWRQTFHALPTVYGVSAVGGFALAFYYYLKTNRMGWLIFSVVCLFALYGAKVTNLFFMPGLGLVLLLQRRWRAVAVLISGFLFMYGLETLFISGLNGWTLPFGRIQGLLFRGYAVDEVMGFDYPTDNIPLLLLMRWVHAHPLSKKLYFAFWLLAPLALWWVLQRRKRGSLSLLDLHATAFTAMGMSFAVLTTFFVISLDPFRIGQPIMARYLMILLPFAVYTLFWLSFTLQAAGADPIRLGMFMALFLFLLNVWSFLVVLIVMAIVGLSPKRTELATAYRSMNSARSWQLIGFMLLAQFFSIGFQVLQGGGPAFPRLYLVTLGALLLLVLLFGGSKETFWQGVRQRLQSVSVIGLDGRHLFSIGVGLLAGLFFLWVREVWVLHQLYLLVAFPVLLIALIFGVLAPGRLLNPPPTYISLCLIFVLLFTGIAPHARQGFPFYARPNAYNVWTVDAYFDAVTETLKLPDACIVFDTVFDEAWAANSLPGILTTDQADLVLASGLELSQAQDYLTFDVPSRSMFAAQEPLATLTRTCQCETAYYYGFFDKNVRLTAQQLAILNTNLDETCNR